MPYEPLMFRCDSCNARIVLRGGSVLGSHPQPKPIRQQDSGDEHAVLFEGTCPQCREPFQIWQAKLNKYTHVTDLQFDRPDVFTGKGRERAEQVVKNREDREAAQKEAERQREIRLAEEAERRKREAEERQAKLEAKRVERREAARARASTGADDWDDDGDYGGSGGSSQADLDNHANQMNPNNDAYWSSRGA